jgi:hypothetical protein
MIMTSNSLEKFSQITEYLERSNTMRTKKLIVNMILLIALVSMSMPVSAAQRDLGHETLSPNDGWASFGAGTTGGSQATQVYTVTNRAELIAALNTGGQVRRMNQRSYTWMARLI